MLPNPLHPMIVHFPVVLSVLLPLGAFGALYAIRSGARPMRAWGVALAMAAALTLSSWVAVETGEQQEEKVESVVGESRLGTHAQAGQALLAVSAGVLALLALGLLPGNRGKAARYVGAASTLALVVMAYRVGHSGGEMVYSYGAASAYAGGAPVSGGATVGGAATGTVAADTTAAFEPGRSGEAGESEEHERGERGERRRRD